MLFIGYNKIQFFRQTFIWPLRWNCWKGCILAFLLGNSRSCLRFTNISMPLERPLECMFVPIVVLKLGPLPWLRMVGNLKNLFNGSNFHLIYYYEIIIKK